MNEIIFRHHESGTPRPRYIRPTIAPLPVKAWSLTGLLLVRLLVNSEDMRRRVSLQIKKTIH